MPIMNTVIAGGGTTPTGTIQITSNGITDVTNYASADVQVPTTAPARYLAFEISYGTLRKDLTNPLMDFTGVTTIGNYALAGAYYNNTTITSVNLNAITTVEYGGLLNAFYGSSITSFSMDGITSFNDPYSHQRLVSVCAYCANLTTATFNGVTTIGSSGVVSGSGGDLYLAFQECGSLRTVRFNSLNSITGASAIANMFSSGCQDVDIYFPAITTTSFGVATALRNSGSGVTNITYHFPSNVQATVEALTGYSATAPFSAISGTVLFDLPATA